MPDLQRLAGNAVVARALTWDVDVLPPMERTVQHAEGESRAPVFRPAGPLAQRAAAGDEEVAALGRNDRADQPPERVLKLLAEILPEAAPLVVQGIGNALPTLLGARIYAVGIALNGSVGLSELLQACYRLRSDPTHVPSLVRLGFGAMNLVGAVTYGHSQSLQGHRKAVQSAAGAIIQGLSYVGIIVTKNYITRAGREKPGETELIEAGTGLSEHPQGIEMRRRRPATDSASVQAVAAPRLPPLNLPGAALGWPASSGLTVARSCSPVESMRYPSARGMPAGHDRSAMR
ncbi:hypothetical protein [Streptomyces sp. NPDC004250]|uniref:hypothetical protein n=1 Tax=Streptomyces sp. NPDC004250 TaxID=3364692 RepID=UPI0036BE0B5F